MINYYDILLFSNVQVRDGVGPFSPLIGRYCGTSAPGDLTSSGPFMWIKFFSGYN